jgi:hypothetical protein
MSSMAARFVMSWASILVADCMPRPRPSRERLLRTCICIAKTSRDARLAAMLRCQHDCTRSGIEYCTVLQLALSHTYDSPCSCGTCIPSLSRSLEDAGITVIISKRSSNHACKSGEYYLGGWCFASSDPCCHASPLKSTPASNAEMV